MLRHSSTANYPHMRWVGGAGHSTDWRSNANGIHDDGQLPREPRPNTTNKASSQPNFDGCMYDLSKESSPRRPVTLSHDFTRTNEVSCYS